MRRSLLSDDIGKHSSQLVSYFKQRVSIPLIAAKNLVDFVDEVVECLSVSEFSTTPHNPLSSWKQGNVGCLFLWFVSFGQAKEMNAPRRAADRSEFKEQSYAAINSQTQKVIHQ